MSFMFQVCQVENGRACLTYQVIGSTKPIWGPLMYLPKLDSGGREADSTSTTEKACDLFLVSSLTFYIYDY